MKIRYRFTQFILERNEKRQFYKNSRIGTTNPLFHPVEFSQHNLNVCKDEHVAHDQKLDVLPYGFR